MRYPFLLLSLLIIFSLAANVTHGQGRVSNKDALQYIKTGNTLREAQQYERAEQFLKIGLDATKGKNKYWEASAYEFLGLLYRDVSDTTKAIYYLNEALDLYKSLRVATSTKAVAAILNGMQGKPEYYAGVEIGAKGIKLSIIAARLNIEGIYQFKLIYDDSVNPNIVNLTDEAIKTAIEAVNNYIKIAKEEYKIPDEHLYIIGSSGIGDVAKRENKLEALTERINEGVNGSQKINFITAKEEAFLVIQGSTLPKYRAISSTIDIGSGNTKGGFVRGIGGKLLEPVTFSFGTETLVPKIKARQLDGDISYDSAATFIKEDLKKEIHRAFNANPGLRTRSIVHLVGGVTWAATSYLYPENAQELFVRVSPRQLKIFRKIAIETYDKATNPPLESLTDSTLHAMAASNIAQAKEDFGQDQLIAGLVILEAILEEYNNAPPQKKFYYARQGYIGWITGYIIEKIKAEYEALKE